MAMMLWRPPSRFFVSAGVAVTVVPVPRYALITRSIQRATCWLTVMVMEMVIRCLAAQAIRYVLAYTVMSLVVRQQERRWSHRFPGRTLVWPALVISSSI